jgi:regulator of sirC expression with transglutaminase-like and TPR domain
MESGYSQAAGFVVVADSERQQIEKELAAISPANSYQAATARARVLVNHRLWYDAIGAYSNLIKQFPERAELYEERGTVYAQIEATKAQADADFARADELQAKKSGN